MKRYGLLVLAAGLLTVLLSFATGAGAAGSRSTVTVTPGPQIPAGARHLGAVAGGASEAGAVVLRSRDEGALRQFIAAVTNPGSSSFHHYLAPGVFAGRFGPTRATIDAATSQLRADGLRVTSVSSDGLIVSFKGSASQVESAFHTGLASYKLSDGSTGQATTSAIRVSSSIAASVSGVVGLDNLVHARPASILHAPASARGKIRAAKTAQVTHPPGSPTPCGSATADARANGGLTDDQIAHAYGAFGVYGAGDLGAGQHIAIFELEPFLSSDLRTFDTCYFGATAASQMAGRLRVIPVDGGLPTGTGSGEAILDVEDVSAMAPGANIDVYDAPNTDMGSLDAYAAIVNDDKDKVASSSWAVCEQLAQLAEPGIQQAENALFEQAAAQGQSVFSAAGDTGSDSCNEFRYTTPPAGQNPLSLLDPASQPYVVAVGGTTITDATQPPQEHVWNDGAEWGGGGGGISQSWTMPAWQRDSKVPGIVLPGSADYTNANQVESQFGYPQNFCQAYLAGASASTPCRTVPDVSAQADEFTGAVTIYSTIPGYYGWQTVGGTSSATPIWAAMLALVNSSAACAENSETASGVGFVSPLLYAVASDSNAYKASFNDVTTGNNDSYGLDNGLVFPASSGYDLASGLGSPQLTAPGGRAGLAFYLCSYGSKTSRPAVTNLAPAVLSTAGGAVTITGTGFKSGGSSDVAGIQVGTWQVPVGKFTVDTDTTITATFPPAADTVPPGSPSPQDGAGPAPVIVTRTGGESSTPGPASTLEYVDESSSSPVPSVTGLSPSGTSETAPKTVTILGSGFTGATAVSFGGVPAKSFTVLSPFEIAAMPAAYSDATMCAPLPSTGVYAGENATNDICQVQAQVTNAHGANALGQILPPYEGQLNFSSALGSEVLPPGCNCEDEPAPTELDYVPAPSITSISTSTASPGSLASELGGTLVTVTGKGFDPLTLDYADLGDPTQAPSILYPTYEAGTQIQFVAPAISGPGAPPSVQPVTLPFSVRGIAGQSNEVGAVYAGIPEVSGALNTATGHNGAVDTGGAPLAISGEGFEQAVGPVEFVDYASPFSLGTQYTYTVNSDSSISTETVSQNPALVDVEVCSVTGCSLNPPADHFYLYPPGNPTVTSVTPASGPAAGGTAVVIRGQNLGCVTGVFFGSVLAEKFSNEQALLDCGSTYLVNATSPPGKAGTKVKVIVKTVESDFAGPGSTRSTATFTYTP